jgi:hypothetical protein
VVDELETPELYDLRFGSGVVREDDGVTLFRGIRDGEGADWRPTEGGGSVCEGVGGVNGIGGGLCIIDNLFSLRASVGLIVRAPRPVACALPGMMDILLFDEGVFDPGNAARPGDRAVPIGELRVGSGVLIGVKNSS